MPQLNNSTVNLTRNIFDHFDVYDLANRFSIPELRREITRANINAKVAAEFSGTAYQQPADLFPWAEYAECCRASIEAIKAAKPTPAQPSNRRIDAEDIKRRNDIVDIVERYTQLRKSGHNRFTGKCPLHSDRGPSLTVYADTQSWHCFGACNRGGDVFDFIQAAENVDFKRAAEILTGGAI